MNAPRGPRRRLLDSSVLKKVLMAGTGALLVGFVLAHMTGNLKAFQGAEKFNAYAEFIRDFGAPALPREGFLWIQRVGLLGVLVAHVWAAWSLTRQSLAARPVPYARKPKSLAFTYASRTMRWGGVVILLFVVYHILHFTTGTVHPAFDHTNPYSNLVLGFSNPWVSGVYALAVTALALHMAHGVWSAFQTLGLDNPRYEAVRRPLAMGLALIVWAGFLVVPLGVIAGWIG